jgi:hypothetical protein
LEERNLLATYYISPTGNDNNPGTLNAPFATIQHGLNVALHPGDTIMARAGTYNEKITFPASGSAAGGAITLENYPGEQPILDGTNVPGPYMVLMNNVSYVTVAGFEIQNDLGLTDHNDGSGIRVLGFGSNITLQNNLIHDILGTGGAMGITVYGTSSTPIQNLLITGNQVYHCDPGHSEALTLNGNITNFQITNNLVHDVDNIGIDMIGGDTSIQRNQTLVTRNGVCSGNTVYNANSTYGGGYAGGIYVDGGKNITLEDNISYQNDLGLEIGAENKVVASGIVVEDNLIYQNDKAGLVFGGYASNVGRVKSSKFLNNTVYDNDTLNTGNGQLWIQYASSNIVTNNIFFASPENVLIGSFNIGSNTNNLLDHNLYFAAAGAAKAQFNWNGRTYSSYAAYQRGTGEDAHSPFGDPLFVNAAAASFQLMAGSPALDAGSSRTGQFDPVDFTGLTRGSPPDIGAYELEPSSPLFREPPMDTLNRALLNASSDRAARAGDSSPPGLIVASFAEADGLDRSMLREAIRKATLLPEPAPGGASVFSNHPPAVASELVSGLRLIDLDTWFMALPTTTPS